MGELVERYLLLGLRLGKLVPGLVDAYYGPEELSGRVAREGTPDPARLAEEADDLLASVDGAVGDPERARWLGAQLVGVRTVAGRLAGEPLSYLDEVEACFGVRPALVAEEEFARAHEALDATLPGDGSVKERFQAWERMQAVEREALLGAFGVLAEEARARTRELAELPQGESVALELVQHEPWLRGTTRSAR
jgi:hypothetical protein